MKKRGLMIIDIILVLILIVIMIFGILNSLKSDASKFKSEYEALNDENVKIEISKNNPIQYVNIDKVFEIFENKTGVIYFGFPGCPWCRNMLPILFEAAKNNNIDIIYYFNPKEIRSSDNDDYNKLISILNHYLKENEAGEKTLYVPDVYFVKEGQIVGHHLGTVDSQTNPMESLTDGQKQELLNIFDELFSKIK